MTFRLLAFEVVFGLLPRVWPFEFLQEPLPSTKEPPPTAFSLGPLSLGPLHLTSMSSTSKTRVAPGGIAGGEPRDP